MLKYALDLNIVMNIKCKILPLYCYATVTNQYNLSVYAGLRRAPLLYKYSCGNSGLSQATLLIVYIYHGSAMRNQIHH